jgi:hypothetical protein
MHPLSLGLLHPLVVPWAVVSHFNIPVQNNVTTDNTWLKEDEESA